MMGQYVQYQIPLWLIAFLFLALLLIPMEVGFRLGNWRRRVVEQDEEKTCNDLAVNALLALLARCGLYIFVYDGSCRPAETGRGH